MQRKNKQKITSLPLQLGRNARNVVTIESRFHFSCYNLFHAKFLNSAKFFIQLIATFAFADEWPIELKISTHTHDVVSVFFFSRNVIRLLTTYCTNVSNSMWCCHLAILHLVSSWDEYSTRVLN